MMGTEREGTDAEGPATSPDGAGRASGAVTDRASEALAGLLDGDAAAWSVEARLTDAELRAIPDCAPIQTQVLHNRGVRGAEAVRALLARGWQAPPERVMALPGLAGALKRLGSALDRRERIVVFGDYDCDGITSCALLLLALRTLGGDAEGYIPTRDDDGRGLNLAALDELAARGTRLLMTTDCGTTNLDEVAYARARGMDVIVTDHHPAHSPIAGAVALVNPQLRATTDDAPAGSDDAERDDPERNDAERDDGEADLTGAGVALRVAAALFAERGRGGDALRLDGLLDLAAIGTLADVGRLSPANWAIARAGLRRLNSAPRAGLRALMRVAGLAAGEVTARDIGFALAPRLNAAARLGQPRLALDLLLTEDAAEAGALAARLEALNAERQRLTDDLLAEARRQAHSETQHAAGVAPPVIIAQGEGWPLGLLGLVAGRLADEMRRPAFVISQMGGERRGSARSPRDGEGAVNLGAALATRPELFKRFGGHAQAAGFTLAATTELDDFLAYLRALFVAQPAPSGARETAIGAPGPLRIDCQLQLRKLSPAVYQDVAALAPFGPGFPEPVFVARGLRLLRCWRSGTDGRSLRLALRDGERESVALWARRGESCDALRVAIPLLPPLDLVYTLDAYRSRYTGALEITPRVVALARSPQATGETPPSPSPQGETREREE